MTKGLYRFITIPYLIKSYSNVENGSKVGGNQSYHEIAFFHLHGCGFLQKLLFSCEYTFPIVSCYKLSESIKKEPEK